MLCFARRVSAGPGDGDDAAGEAEQRLVLRAVWEWHWAIVGFFAAVAGVCLAGTGWAWRNSDNSTLGLRLLLAAGAVLSLGTGVVFVYAARADTVTFDRRTGRWYVTRRTYPWPCAVYDSTPAPERDECGELRGVTAVYASPHSKRDLELALANGHANAIAANDERAGLLSEPSDRGLGRSDEKGDGAAAVAGAGAAQPVAAAAAANAPADRGAHPNRSCHCGQPDASGFNTGCGNRTLVLVIGGDGQSGRHVPVMEGSGASCTALCNCGGRGPCNGQYLDVETAVDLVNAFLRSEKSV